MAKAKRSTPKAKQARARSQVSVSDHEWGSIFTGTKENLTAAGLLPRRFKLEEAYWLPLNWRERHAEAVYGPNYGPVPPRWKAEAHKAWEDKEMLSVHVRFSPDRDLNVMERTEKVLAAFPYRGGDFEIVRKLIAEIPPRPLSEQLPEAIRHG